MFHSDIHKIKYFVKSATNIEGTVKVFLIRFNLIRVYIENLKCTKKNQKLHGNQTIVAYFILIAINSKT